LSLKHHRRRFVVGLFKKKVIKRIDGPAWGYPINEHKVYADTFYRDMRYVERKRVLEEKVPITFLRVFNIKETEQRRVTVSGWEAFDQHPDLILFEGYITETNEAYLERKRT
jgi:hypothetical protein